MVRYPSSRLACNLEMLTIVEQIVDGVRVVLPIDD